MRAAQEAGKRGETAAHVRLDTRKENAPGTDTEGPGKSLMNLFERKRKSSGSFLERSPSGGHEKEGKKEAQNCRAAVFVVFADRQMPNGLFWAAELSVGALVSAAKSKGFQFIIEATELRLAPHFCDSAFEPAIIAMAAQAAHINPRVHKSSVASPVRGT